MLVTKRKKRLSKDTSQLLTFKVQVSLTENLGAIIRERAAIERRPLASMVALIIQDALAKESENKSE